MSIDYDTAFGIGYEVVASDELEESDNFNDYDGDLNEYLWSEIPDESLVEVMQFGNMFGGDMSEVYVILKDPFKLGPDLTVAKSILESEIKKLNLNIAGEFGLHGGLIIS